MSRRLSDLDRPFRENVDELLRVCDGLGYPMRPFFTLRSPYDQARLWRQSRSGYQVQSKIAQLRSKGAPFLAHCIDAVGPQFGRWATNAIPGLSWHQWGQAVDCYWLLDGAVDWDTGKKHQGKNGYQVYAATAKQLGLTAGGYWKVRDWVHVQLPAESHPGKRNSLDAINFAMAERFPDES